MARQGRENSLFTGKATLTPSTTERIHVHLAPNAEPTMIDPPAQLVRATAERVTSTAT